MTIVSDTSPVTNLMQIGQLRLLQGVFGMVILPEAVYEELCVIAAELGKRTTAYPKMFTKNYVLLLPKKPLLTNKTGFLFKNLPMKNWFWN